MSSDSSNSSDDESRNKSRRKRRGYQKTNSSDHHRESNRGRYDADRNDRRNKFHKNNSRQERKRRLETPPPRRNDHPRHMDDEGPSKRSKDDRQRDFKNNKRDSKSSFERERIKKEASPQWGKANIKNEEKPKPQEKEKPNFGLSGKLTEDTNTVNGVVIKYAEPDDAMKPKRRWRLYQFKGEKSLPTLYIHRQSAFLMGRDRKIADIPLDHPSCSKQHAALQYRLVPYSREDGSQGRRVRPYLIDLESANGTFVNDVKLEGRRYHELLERDVIKFGFSTREYVLLHEKSKDEDQDDDVPSSSK
ncbi:smad nuclear-interacting protein 1 [Leptopilina boulardi]|uniref:smad nuclear-interacting protein 1 n=1 Tax=Leptopilina boulardi TaxID=63433 RepID=UPI0021F56EFA|nr:smad nuclear-interacting protein 1 [Leptopilina boulardi]